MEGCAALGHQVDDGLMNSGGQRARGCLVDSGHWRIGAHPARIGPLVALEDALEVACRCHGQRAHSVAQRQQRQLLADQKLLDDGACALLSEAAV